MEYLMDVAAEISAVSRTSDKRSLAVMSCALPPTSLSPPRLACRWRPPCRRRPLPTCARRCRPPCRRAWALHAL
eukprot:320331-Pyramimonas_sp.AAC.1